MSFHFAYSEAPTAWGLEPAATHPTSRSESTGDYDVRQPQAGGDFNQNRA